VYLPHEQNIIFGDLREPNILYDVSKSCTFVTDFDWPAADGVSRYPSTLNLTDQRPEVVPYGIMHRAHDLWQLERLEDLFQRGAYLADPPSNPILLSFTEATPVLILC